jgi:hypothetical protein
VADHHAAADVDRDVVDDPLRVGVEQKIAAQQPGAPHALAVVGHGR